MSASASTKTAALTSPAASACAAGAGPVLHHDIRAERPAHPLGEQACQHVARRARRIAEDEFDGSLLRLRRWREEQQEPQQQRRDRSYHEKALPPRWYPIVMGF